MAGREAGRVGVGAPQLEQCHQRTVSILTLTAILAIAAVLTGGCAPDESYAPAPIDSGQPPQESGPLGELLAVDERLELANLRGPVDAVRDEYGRLHIYATDLEDALRVQGYLVARDRTVQLELLRRLAEGRTAAVLGQLDPSLVESDIAFRHLGLARTAQAQYDSLSPELRRVFDAFADGITQLFRQIRLGQHAMATGIVGVPLEAFTDWSAVDTLAIGRLQTWLLSYTGAHEIEFQQVFDGLRTTFSADSEDWATKRRAGLERDLLRFDPGAPATTIAGPTEIGGGSGPPWQESPSGQSPAAASQTASRPPASEKYSPPRTSSSVQRNQQLAASGGYRRALSRARSWFGQVGQVGSNNWAIAPERSSTGHALLASDPHLTLTSPAIFWPVSLHVSPGAQPSAGAVLGGELHIAGVAFPGIPGIILGHNQHVAWGATVAGYDVTDVYSETLVGSGEAVLFAGNQVALQTIDEVIEVKDGPSVVYPVKIVPHHGPVIPTIENGTVLPLDPAQGALSVRWTGFEPTTELEAVVRLWQARDVDEARAAFAYWGVGAQNWMLADTAGNILWTSHAHVPRRDLGALAWDPASYEGLLPCLVLPGDGSAEWVGYWPSDYVPWAKNPAMKYLATANNDPLGGTIDNDPADDLLPTGSSAFLSCSFAKGFRQERIQQLIQAYPSTLSLADLAAIQADVRSPLAAILVPHLIGAIDAAQLEYSSTGTAPQLHNIVHDPSYDPASIAAWRAIFVQWRDEADYRAAAGIDLDDNQPLELVEPNGAAARATLVFNTWLVRLLARTFGDELARVSDETDVGDGETGVDVTGIPRAGKSTGDAGGGSRTSGTVETTVGGQESITLNGFLGPRLCHPGTGLSLAARYEGSYLFNEFDDGANFENRLALVLGKRF